MSGRYLLDANIIIALFARETAVHERLTTAEEVFVPWGPYRVRLKDCVILSPSQVILSVAKNLACSAQDKLREESRLSKYLRSFTSFRMTRKSSFSTAC